MNCHHRTHNTTKRSGDNSVFQGWLPGLTGLSVYVNIIQEYLHKHTYSSSGDSWTKKVTM